MKMRFEFYRYLDMGKTRRCFGKALFRGLKI
jgi:hypothetical protein